jgi:dipeptidase E
MTGLGILEGTVVPHLDSPEHPECAALTTIAERLRAEGRSIIELRDGDVLIMAGAERILLPRSGQV